MRKDQYVGYLVAFVAAFVEIIGSVVIAQYYSLLSIRAILILLIIPVGLIVWIIKGNKDRTFEESLQKSLVFCGLIIISLILVGVHKAVVKGAKTPVPLPPTIAVQQPIPPVPHPNPPIFNPIPTKKVHKKAPVKQGVTGSNNTQVGDDRPITGNGNTIIGATDSNRNTILTQGGTAIGANSTAGPTSVAIGANAHAEEPITQSCTNGICNGSGSEINAPQIVDNRQYGVAMPPPNIVGLTRTQLPAMPPTPQPHSTNPLIRKQERMAYLTSVSDGKQLRVNPGVALSFHVDAAFTTPMFEIHCGRPCVGAGLDFITGGTGVFRGKYPFRATSDSSVFIVESGDIKVLASDTAVVIEVRSIGSDPLDPLKVTVRPYMQ